MSKLWLQDPLGERPLSPEDLPLSVGGPGADVVVPGCAPGELCARVDLQDDGLEILPPEGAESAALDGIGITLETRDGGHCIVVTHAGTANVTVPPQLEGQPLEAAAEQGDRLPLPVADYHPPGRRVLGPRAPLRWGRAAAWAAGAAVVAVIGFLVAATPVSVQTRPALTPDDVDFRGTALDLGFGGHYLLLPGEYELAVEAEGYAPVAQPVTITRQSRQEILVALERLPGLVAFDTGGIAATLFVDGIERGALPGEIELEAGTRELLVQAPRHAEARLRLEVDGGGNRQTVEIGLEPVFAPVSVASVPAGAAVRVDGRELGTTPLETELDAGRYELEISHPRFRRFETQITVRAGEPLVVGPVELGMPDGTLVVRTQPAGADVSVGGRYRGRTPLRLGLPPGVPQDVVVNRAGYEPVERTVRVESRAEQALALSLEPILGEVTVRGEPADAELFVDGERRGAANQTLSLPSAPHEFEVRKPGFAPWRAQVTPRRGQPQTVQYLLQTPAEARLARTPREVATGLRQPMVLVTGGRFTLGSPRREPGRRSNETERTVELKRPFYLSRHQVTNRDFRAFRAEHASGIHKDESLDLDRQPAVRVSWNDAAAFCNWLSERDKLPPAYELRGGRYELVEPVTTGYRLPTEAEWEFAVRHDGSAAARKYPWGDDLPVPARSGNWADVQALYLVPVVISGYDDGHRVAAPVGSFGPNPLGLFDLGGNVFEWTHDRYSIYVVASDHVATDPTGPKSGDSYVIRGASWMTGRVTDLRAATREAGSSGRMDLGFRIARYAE